MLDARNHKVYVHGKWVPFTEKAINAVLGIPDVPIRRDEYRMFLDRDKDFNEILEQICIPGIQW